MSRQALPAPMVLNKRYRIERVIAGGGFGITYLGTNLGLNNQIAIKEYFPGAFAYREGTTTVRSSSGEEGDHFETGRVNFLNEAQTLARFRHPSIVRVSDVFEENNTAYMIMDFEQGPSLERWLADLGRAPTQDEIDRMILPVLGALEVLHEHEPPYLHRDIAPDNILIRPNQTPVLIDFGAARQSLRQQSQTIGAIVKVGYSPAEQYSVDVADQGPWTDIYAFAATLYRAVTGRVPPDAPSRLIRDTCVPAVEKVKGAYRPQFLAGIDHGLAVRYEDRPQTIRDWRRMLSGTDAPAVVTRSATPTGQRLPTPVAAAAGLAARALPSAHASPIAQLAANPATEQALLGIWALTLGAFLLAGGLPVEAGTASILPRALLVANCLTLLAMLARSALLVFAAGPDTGTTQTGIAGLIGAAALPLGLFWPFGTLGLAMAGPALAVAGLARFAYRPWLRALLFVAVLDGVLWTGLLAWLANRPFDYVFVVTLAMLAFGTGLLALRIKPAADAPAAATP